MLKAVSRGGLSDSRAAWQKSFHNGCSSSTKASHHGAYTGVSRTSHCGSHAVLLYPLELLNMLFQARCRRTAVPGNVNLIVSMRSGTSM